MPADPRPAAIVHRIVGRAPDPAARAGMLRHFEVTRTPDGVWGLHPEAAGSVFVTTLVYVALRILGVPADDPMTSKARRWLHGQPGGVLAIPTWGKLWLAFLDLYDYRGINPCPPELLLLPGWLPVHPRRYYCHTRHIYLAMSYLYGRRIRAALGPLGDELCHELYGLPRARVQFSIARRAVSATDLRPGPRGLRADSPTSWCCTNGSRPRRSGGARSCTASRRILYEQRQSRYQALSPVNGLLNCLALWAHDPAHPDLEPSLAGVEAWRWEDREEGVRYAGARSHTWDTAFARRRSSSDPSTPRRGTRSAAPTASSDPPSSRRSCPTPGPSIGIRSAGGWCFSDGAHRWPVSDCTAEALMAILRIHAAPGITPASGSRSSGSATAVALHPGAPERRRRLRNLRAAARLAPPRGAEPVGDVP